MHRRALIALDTLSTEEKSNLTQALNNLDISDIDNAVTGNIQRMNTEEPLYFLKVDSELRAIIQINSPDEIEVMDIFTQERLKLFSKSKY
ncbi:hypothetical protein NIES4071_51980 [Calothrix sp. NIES-4071]|nr:hypothetical protein NIES4071_51980 [Calothrix sp. NIES-4071]BAZ59506.1 hypothetical protein NIES4105_51930 [Calothrix sp. NIES-4105]